MKLSDLRKSERIVDSEGREVTFGETQELTRIWTGLSERTPEALWVAADDRWRQKFILADNIMQPITPVQLFEAALHYESQMQRIAEKFSQVASVQTQHYQDQVRQIAEKVSQVVSVKVHLQQDELREKLFQAAKAQAKESANLLTAIDWGKLPLLGIDTGKRFNDFDTKSSVFSGLMLSEAERFKQAFTTSENLMRSITDAYKFDLFAGVHDHLSQFSASLAVITEQVRYGMAGLTDWIEQDRRFYEACAILEIDPDIPDEHYDKLSEEQFWNEVAAVRWLKETAKKGEMQSLAATMQLQKFLKTEQLSGYTLSRFIHLVTGQAVSVAREQPSINGKLEVALSGLHIEGTAHVATPTVQLWVPGNCEFEINVRDAAPSGTQSRTIIRASDHGALVQVKPIGDISEPWRVVTPGQLATNSPVPFEHLPKDDQQRILLTREIEEAKNKRRIDYKVSCDLKGIHEATFRKWRKKYTDYL